MESACRRVCSRHPFLGRNSMRRIRMWAIALTTAIVAGLALTATPAQAASTHYQPILMWPGNNKIGDRWIVYFDRNETASIASTGASAATGVLSRAGVPGAVVTAAGFVVKKVSKDAVSKSGKCATLQLELFWGWLPNVSGWVRNC